jgi:hypothetical protein
MSIALRSSRRYAMSRCLQIVANALPSVPLAPLMRIGATSAMARQSAGLAASTASGRCRPSDELYDAKVKVLGEYIGHHCAGRGGEMFPQCRRLRAWISPAGARRWPSASRAAGRVPGLTPGRRGRSIVHAFRARDQQFHTFRIAKMRKTCGAPKSMHAHGPDNLQSPLVEGPAGPGGARLILASVAMTVVFVLREVGRSTEQVVLDSQEDDARRLAATISQRLVGLQRALRSVALQLPAATLADRPELTEFIASQSVPRDTVLGVFVAVTDGTVLVSPRRARLRDRTPASPTATTSRTRCASAGR